MRILMVTPHLPPHQAANALLPHLLGEAARTRGHEVRYLALGNGVSRPDAVFVNRRLSRLRITRLPQLIEAIETWTHGKPLVRWADVVHIHSNTWMNQVAAKIAWRAKPKRPYVLTHYGTEIWHYDGRGAAFRRLNARARRVTYYSQGLFDRARELGLPLEHACVVYPPVSDVFHPADPGLRAAVRSEMHADDGPLLLNVKRLHPTADHVTLIEAFARVHASLPRARLLIAGVGETEPAVRAAIERLNVREAVQLLGAVPNDRVAALQGAADLFVLSSVLEATPTVALEALASGTPVVSTDNPGGLELATFFGDDITVVPKRDPDALAQAILTFLAQPRRACAETAQKIAERFRLGGVSARYLALYEEAIGP
jgi:glycosyltransferase involved in cell wall biosynthesis